MHDEILLERQKKLLSLLKFFAKDFYLVGGTAIALQLGHRHSIDFDLFSNKEFNNKNLAKNIKKFGFKIDKVLIDKKDEYTTIINGVKITFLFYDFKVQHKKKFDNTITLPDLLILASMKAYALGRRAKWKDYVDLFFILKEHCSITQVCAQAKKIFGAEFNEKMFRMQLSYFDDIDYSEIVDYLPGFEIKDSKIKKALIQCSLEK